MTKLTERFNSDESGGPFRFGLLAAMGVLIVATTAVGVLRTASVLMTITLAGFLAIGLNRPARALIRLGMSRTLASLLLFLCVSVVLCGGMALILPALIEQATAFLTSVRRLIEQALAAPQLQGMADKQQLNEWLNQVLTPANLGTLLGGLLGGAAGVAGFIATGVTALLLTFFILAAYDRIREGAYRLVPRSRRARAAQLGDEVMEKVGGYLVGAVCIGAVAGTCALIFMLITGIPYPLLLALVVAFLDVIPQVGATTAACVVVAVALGQSLWLAVGAAVFFLVYQQIENWVIYPRVMQRAVEISNLAAIIAVMIGFALLGVLGVLLAVPGYAAAQFLTRELVIPRQDAR